MKPPLSIVDELLDLDPGFADAVDRCPAFPGFPLGEELERTPFQFLAHTVLYQRGSVAGAVTTYRRVSDLLVPPHFPDPEELLGLPDANLLAPKPDPSPQRRQLVHLALRRPPFVCTRPAPSLRPSTRLTHPRAAPTPQARAAPPFFPHPRRRSGRSGRSGAG